MDYVGAELHGGTYDSLSESLGEPNSVAAMPSIHMGVTFAMALWAWTRYPRLAASFLIYSVLMGAALVYLGEHYVADILAGMVCAAAVFAVAVWAFRRFEGPGARPRKASPVV
jgi:membrane-associated phospholipid phosphatase